MGFRTQLFILTALLLSDSVLGRPAGVIKSVPSTYKKVDGVSFLPDAFLVEFDGELHAETTHQKFRGLLQERSIDYEERATFSHFINAVSMHVDPAHLDLIASLPNVKAIWPVAHHKKAAPTPAHVNSSKAKSLPSNLISSPHSLTGVDKVQTELKNTGTGIKVGVIDTGIDYTHPALGHCFGKKCRVQYGYDFVGDGYDGTRKTIKPDSNPKDCDGHGTHVAGIIGAQDPNFVGVAPNVTFGAYKVFGCNSDAPDDLIVKAVELSVKDKMDVINLSLGGPSPFSDDPLTRALNKASELGVVVSVALGNDGINGLWTAGSPSTSTKSLGIASVDNSKYPGQAFSIKQLKRKDLVASWEGLKTVTVKNAPFVIAKEDGCTKFTENIKGKFILLNPPKKGRCDNQVKAIFAQEAGAVGVFVYSATPGIFIPEAMDPKLRIPLMGVNNLDAVYLGAEFEKNSKLTISFEPVHKLFENSQAGQVSSFSSWGPDFELNFKPNFGAPGSYLYSTYPVAKGSFAHLRGTSMATPYATGAIALYLKAKGKVTSAQVGDAFQNTAKPITQLSIDGLTTVAKQGAGLLNVYDAINVKHIITPSNIALNDTTHLNGRHTLTVKNTDKKPISFTISHLPALSVNGYDTQGYVQTQKDTKLIQLPATVKLSSKTITIKPGQSATVSAEFAPPKVAKGELYIYSGYIQFSGDHSQVLRVPYLGVAGDLHSRKVIARNGIRAPTMIGKKSEKPQTAYTFKGEDYPVVSVDLIHPTLNLVASLVDKAGKPVGVVGQIPNSGRFIGDYQLVEFNGTVVRTIKGQEHEYNVPKGSYRIKVAALKPFGNPKEEKSYDVWLSQLFKRL